MLAGRPHEAAGNGSPRWMTAAPRKRAHRTRPTGRLTPHMGLTCGAASNAGQPVAVVDAAKGIGAISSRLKMADCCVYGIYRLREGRHSGNSRPDIANEVHDAGTAGVFLLENILDGLGICHEGYSADSVEVQSGYR
jgi:hypothetical protein